MVPGYVNKPLYLLAPVIAIVAAMIGFAVVPFGPVGPNQLDRFPDRARHRYRHPLHLRRRQPGGLRRDPGGLGVEQQVFIHRRPALECPVDQLRDPAGAVDPGDGLWRRLARPERDHQLAGLVMHVLGRRSSRRSAS